MLTKDKFEENKARRKEARALAANSAAPTQPAASPPVANTSPSQPAAIDSPTQQPSTDLSAPLQPSTSAHPSSDSTAVQDAAHSPEHPASPAPLVSPITPLSTQPPPRPELTSSSMTTTPARADKRAHSTPIDSPESNHGPKRLHAFESDAPSTQPPDELHDD